jgi:hypothetical protein
MTDAEFYNLIAASCSMLATAFAAYAAWKAPTSAATLAEKLRREAEQSGEKRKSKINLFTTLMQERAAIYSVDGVRALNLVDVVFNDSLDVREAWADLFSSFDTTNNVPQHAQQERLRKLLAAMAKDIGLSDNLRIDDLSRVYFPTALAQERMIQDVERQQAFARLQKATPSANAQTPQNKLWPPSPE